MRTVLVAAVAALLVAGCSSGGKVDSTESVCDDFAAHAKAGLPAADRADVVASIGEVVDNAAQGVRDAFSALQRTATESDGAYRIAAGGFAQACVDAGWDG